MDHLQARRHGRALKIGSILPDCVPSFLTTRHEFYGTIDELHRRVDRLFDGYYYSWQRSTVFYLRLGEILHYTADYFTYPHNSFYPGTMKDHCIYEGELKRRLKSYVTLLDAAGSAEPLIDEDQIPVFYDTDDIIDFISDCHLNYEKQPEHDIHNDICTIIDVTVKLAFGILSLSDRKVRDYVPSWN